MYLPLRLYYAPDDYPIALCIDLDLITWLYPCGPEFIRGEGYLPGSRVVTPFSLGFSC
jgi:hypothetical protein